MPDATKDRLSPLTKLAYGAGDFGFSFTDSTLGGILFARFYPLSREMHAETREQIAMRKAGAD